jgi:DNA-binding response OmpR family regulator
MTTTQTTPSAKLLVADDDEAFRTGFIQLLGRHGYECIGASSADAALRLLQTDRFDALIADVQMPGNTGLEFIRTVARKDVGLPIILLTGQPSVETAIRAVGLPVTAYLLKPPTLEELLMLLRGSVASYRRLRWVEEGRERLRQWDLQLQEIAQSSHWQKLDDEHRSAGDHFRVTLRHIMMELGTLDQSITAWRRESGVPGSTKESDLIGAIRHTISVLEQTKQNFKSQRLADLRRQLVNLLEA